MDIIENKWEENDSDEEYDEEENFNDIPSDDINQEFKNNILSVKHIIYDNTILQPEVGSKDIQSNKLINKYLWNINHVYVLCLNAQKGIINESDINKLTEKAREPTKNILQWVSNFFKNNREADTIPYADYIKNSFHNYQFIQNNSFE
jgi:hypothetical protein